MQPSKPRRSGEPNTDTVKIEWEPPKKQLDPPISYELRYKILTEEEESSKWIRHKEYLKECFFKLDNLPSGAKCIFQVRMVNDDDEGPYSEQSDELETVESEARRAFSKLINVQKQNVKIPVKRVPFEEDKTLRDEDAKTRKFTYGIESKTPVKEKTIMILGPTGAGKSTLVDGMMNYIFGVSWRDNFRLTVETIEADEKEAEGNQAMSQTVWITCYTIHPMKGLKIPYKITIIDTPGYGDVKGIDADIRITEQIRKLFTAQDKKGILFLDALCFVVKASDARLTKTQEYIFNSILSLFQKDIIENFCMMVTFADGNTPEVLSALKAAKLPHEQYFSFNNSALFADNGDSSEIKRSLLDWNLGRKGFDEFFEALEKLSPKSLALSKEVLTERKRKEITVENMKCKINAALVMSENLNERVSRMKESNAIAEEHKNFTYTDTEFKNERKPSGNYNLNCNTCNETCHMDCRAWNMDWVISQCDVFESGYCTQCLSCTASHHTNEKYVYQITTKKVTKTYEDIKQKYDTAAEAKLTHKGLIEAMERELLALNNEINVMIETVVESNARIKQIALRDDPLSLEDQYDIWIHEEETNTTEGWKERVKKYRELKHDAGIQKTAQDTKNKIEASLAEACRVKNGKEDKTQQEDKKKAKGFKTLFSFLK